MNLSSLKSRIQNLKLDILAAWIAARDPATGHMPRLVALVVAAYALSPIDLIPDFIPVLGYLDDLILVPLGVALFIRLIPNELMEDYRHRASKLAIRPISYTAATVIVVLWFLAIALTYKYFFAAHSS